MKRHIVFLVRYSVLLPQLHAGWRKAREAPNLETYARTLFSESRLASKLTTLKEVVLASLSGQKAHTDCELSLLLFISEALPLSERGYVYEAVEQFEGAAGVYARVSAIESPILTPAVIKPVYRNFSHAFTSFLRASSDRIDEGDLVATVRLDDDDALGRSFSSSLASHMAACTVGYAISFPSGYEARFDEQRMGFCDVRERYSPKIALGLSYVSRLESGTAKNVMSLGNHTTIDERVPLILDARRPMWVRGRNAVNDTGDPDYLRKLPSPSSLAVIKREFPRLAFWDGPDS